MRIAVRPLRIPRPHFADRVLRLSIAFSAGSASVTACDYNEYPIEATFCDDWCRVVRRTGCEQEPENCVRDCESALPSDRCFAFQSSLLDCYESTPADRFECVGQGFQSTVRPTADICTAQRHDLIRCEVPLVMECVEACLAIDTSASNEAASPAGPPPAESSEPAASSMLDGPVPPCPEPPFPCERLCWELDARFGRGRPTTLTSIDTTDTTDLAAIGEPLVRCAAARAEECRVAAAAADSAAADPPEPVSWTSAFLECAGLPADVGLLD
jgi:hypothetical protein